LSRIKSSIKSRLSILVLLLLSRKEKNLMRSLVPHITLLQRFLQNHMEPSAIFGHVVLSLILFCQVSHLSMVQVT